jgi:tripartite-type tricarboxylate transporter receptor subunit TctC
MAGEKVQNQGNLMSRYLGRLLLMTLAWNLAVVGVARSAQSFYEGKSIKLIVGFSAGGGFDTYSRLIARHLGKHIPGNPSIVVENMTGAASLVAANHVYNVAKPDGLTILNFHGNQVVNQVIGKPGIEFDARKFEYIGIPTQDNVACAFTKASGITNFDALRNAKTPVKLGGVAPGDTTYNTAKLLQAALKLPIQLVAGYKGTAEVRLAAEAGEVTGGCWQWESIKSIWRQGLDSGNVFIALQVNAKPHPELAKVPNAIDYAPNENGKLLLKFGGHDPSMITRPYALSPGTPRDRVQLLRKAFVETLKDPDFMADAKKSRLDTDPLTGEEIEKIVLQLFKINPALVDQLKEILK